MAKIPVDGGEGPPDVCVIELGGTIGVPSNTSFQICFCCSLDSSLSLLLEEKVIHVSIFGDMYFVEVYGGIVVYSSRWTEFYASNLLSLLWIQATLSLCHLLKLLDNSPTA